MASSFTTNKTLEKPGNGDYVDTWNVPVNADLDVIDQAFGGTTSINVTAVSGVTTLSASQYRSLIIAFSGTLTANVDYRIPSTVGGQWVVTNAATGAFTVTVSSAGGGTSVVVAAGVPTSVYSDGTNIKLSNFVTSDSIEDGAITTAKIDDGAVTYPKINSAVLATASEFQSDTASKVLPVESVWDAAEYVAVTYASSVTLDLNAGFNFSTTLTGNITLANPTNAKPGQSGVIVLTQDGTGGRTTSFGTNFKFGNGVAPTFDTAASRVNVITYAVITSSFIVVTVLPGVR